MSNPWIIQGFPGGGEVCNQTYYLTTGLNPENNLTRFNVLSYFEHIGNSTSIYK